MSMPSNVRLVRILQDRLESRQLEASNEKMALLDNLSDDERSLLGEAMSIAWEEGYDQGQLDEAEHHQEQ